ncbi:hypothetical protein M9Y10_012169 [Tritrichomonas musculus]|uniref:F5/8 type C domain-containing protein n=1 Tax=Tritrichomonas musculus TaxID=1915356 RepID=A0ABR2IBU3_9EUKA
MSETIKMQLKQSCIMHIPIQNYGNDFTFMVNEQKFKTNRLTSDLLSPKIAKMHLIDPTFEFFTIKTKNHGDFAHILNLINFEQNDIPENELPFIAEVIEILELDSFEFTPKIEGRKITIDKVFNEIQNLEKNSEFCSQNFEEKIDFISFNFYILCEEYEEYFANLKISTIYKILSNDQLRLENEDQLLNFINKLYSKNSMYSILYEKVMFTNVSSKYMNEFVELFDFNDISSQTWINLCMRLTNSLEIKKIESCKKRYNTIHTNEIYQIQKTLFKYDKNNDFSGILNFLRKKSNENIEKEINVTSSSIFGNCEDNLPKNVVLFENQMKRFISADEPNSWLCFDFKDHQVILTEYTIKTSCLFEKNMRHPRSWVIEGSNDSNSWEILDEQKDCSEINGKSITHTFSINNQELKKFKMIRLRATGPNWDGSNHLFIESFEIYGRYL